MLRSIRALAVSLALGAALLAVPAASPPSAAGVGPLPGCRLDDILTIPRGYDDWSITLVDWILSVGPEYEPPDLVSISRAGVTGGGLIRRVAFDDLEAMADAADAHGTPLGNVSAYRSYKTQKRLFNDYADGYGFDKAITFSARPGHSEHQLGLAIDFAAAGTSHFVSGTDPTGRWLANNAWKYGWLLSYPKGKKVLTCYRNEPWHYRYVGRELAKEIHESGLTIREYLWAHYTTVDPTTGEPISTASPEVSPSPAIASPAISPPAPTTAATTGSPGTPSAPSVEPTAPPATPAGTWFGLDPPIVVAGALVLLGLTTLAAIGLRSRARRR